MTKTSKKKKSLLVLIKRMSVAKVSVPVTAKHLNRFCNVPVWVGGSCFSHKDMPVRHHVMVPFFFNIT